MSGPTNKRVAGVVGLVVTLGAIALYFGPSARSALGARQKKEVARRDLIRVLEQQRRFHARFGEYLTIGAAGASLAGGEVAWPNGPCPTECRGLAIEACAHFACIDFVPEGMAHHRYACRAHRTGDAYDVTCAAAADLDGDGVISLWAVGTSTSGHLRAPLPPLGPTVDPRRCARLDDVPAGVVYDCTPDAL